MSLYITIQILWIVRYKQLTLFFNPMEKNKLPYKVEPFRVMQVHFVMFIL